MGKPPPNPKPGLSVPYTNMTLFIGCLGVSLPLAMWFLDGVIFSPGTFVQDSLSAYYHTGARDLFVPVLCVTGLLLITYMAGQRRPGAFWLSTVAGVAGVLVALFPTYRINHAALPRCGLQPAPVQCTQLQQKLGEACVARFHAGCAAVFIVSLGLVCFLIFARDEKRNGHDGFARFHQGCALAILLAILWVVGGPNVGKMTALYIGEVVSVFFFGLSWIVRARTAAGQLGGQGFRLVKKLTPF